MTGDDVLEYLRRPDAVVAFDTNTIFGSGGQKDPGAALIACVNRINTLRATPIRKVVPAVVYHEKLRQMRQMLGARFIPSLPEGFLDSKKIEVESFDKPHAERTAERLGRLYPNQGEWRAFKKRRCLECVGLHPGTETAGDGSACGATIDWLIASQADANGYLLVTNDAGPEFVDVARRTSLDIANAAAQRLLDEVTAT
jgi:predicted nucleic acid-binding protein